MTASQHTRGRFPGLWRAVRGIRTADGPSSAWPAQIKARHNQQSGQPQGDGPVAGVRPDAQ